MRLDQCFRAILALALLAGCAGTATVSKTYEDPAFSDRRYGNFLVIGVADDYEARAMFERELVSRLRGDGASATAYYTVIGRNPPITRSDVSNAVRSRNFDAVLLTRVIEADTEARLRDSAPDAEATARGGSLVNLFRYDYAELNEPARVDLSTGVTLVTDLYSAADEKRIWSIRTTSSGHPHVADLVDVQADAIARALRQDALIGGR